MNIYKEKEMELYDRWRSGDNTAKTELLSSLKPLINRQAGRFQGSGLPDTAIRLEGVRLASSAIDTYDPTKAQLNTHVTNYLKKLSRFVTDYQNVGHIPEPRALMIGKYNTIYSNLEADKGREPTVVELSDAMQVSIAEIERLQSELRKDLSLSIEESDDDEEGGFYAFNRPEEDYRQKEAIEAVYFEADPVDKKIMEYTLGLYGAPKLKANQVAKKLKLGDVDLKNRRTAIAMEISQLYK